MLPHMYNSDRLPKTFWIWHGGEKGELQQKVKTYYEDFHEDFDAKFDQMIRIKRTFAPSSKLTHDFNEQVRRTLLDKWLLERMDKYLHRIDDDDPNFSDKININFSEHIRLERMEAVSLLLRGSHRYEEALAVRKKCLDLNAKIYSETSPNMGASYTCMGMSLSLSLSLCQYYNYINYTNSTSLSLTHTHRHAI